MKRFISITVGVASLLIGFSATVIAQLPMPTPEISERPPIDRYPKHHVSFANGVQGIPDIVYERPVGYRPLTLDIYLPPSSVKKPVAGFPLIVQIHGGGWMLGDKRVILSFVDWPSVLASLAGRGYVVASINYRLSSEARFPAQIQDVKAAIRWLRVNESTYGIDPARIATWGPSAGGHLAALAGVSCGATGLEPEGATTPEAEKVSDCVQAIVAWFGVFDMATIQMQARGVSTMSREGREAPEWRLLGCYASECKGEQLAAASPISYADANDPPMLLIVGDSDELVPVKQTLDMTDKLKQIGVKNELIVLPGVGHGFVGKTESETREANLKALAATFAFFDSTIGTKHRAMNK